MHVYPHIHISYINVYITSHGSEEAILDILASTYIPQHIGDSSDIK